MLRIIKSLSHEPYTNLAFENYLFKHPLAEYTLFLYRNTPSVVIGLSQVSNLFSSITGRSHGKNATWMQCTVTI